MDSVSLKRIVTVPLTLSLVKYMAEGNADREAVLSTMSGRPRAPHDEIELSFVYRDSPSDLIEKR